MVLPCPRRLRCRAFGRRPRFLSNSWCPTPAERKRPWIRTKAIKILMVWRRVTPCRLGYKIFLHIATSQRSSWCRPPAEEKSNSSRRRFLVRYILPISFFSFFFACMFWFLHRGVSSMIGTRRGSVLCCAEKPWHWSSLMFEYVEGYNAILETYPHM